MCVKRESFKHKGISVPLGALPGFAVITVPSVRRGGKRLWFGCRKTWTLIKLPYTDTGVPCSFPARWKRGIWGFSLRFWCEIPPPLPPEEMFPAFLGRSVHRSQIARETRLGCSLHSLDSGIFSCWTCPLLPSPLPLPFPPPLPHSPTLQVYVSEEFPGLSSVSRRGARRAGKPTWAVGKRCYSCFISSALWSVTFTC